MFSKLFGACVRPSTLAENPNTTTTETILRRPAGAGVGAAPSVGAAPAVQREEGYGQQPEEHAGEEERHKEEPFPGERELVSERKRSEGA